MQKPNLIGMPDLATILIDGLILIGSAIWVMLPAYLPNNFAALTGGGMPIDFQKNWTDGKRILGDGKTIRGFIGGVTAGILIGGIQMYAEVSGLVPWFPSHTLAAIILLAIGSLLGDMIKSFFKRRRGIDRGGEWFLVDQYDFVAGALVLCLLFDTGWVFSTFTLPLLITILVITPLLHRTVNIIGYKLGLKKVPW
jgi:CDP-2,3-bis-(O-geranylgeranyl)-sn-glycerol synthase